jgi:endonuclease/exonuclease/phosphatase family metal-dependent hydrolase
VDGVVLPYMHDPAPGIAPVWSRFMEELGHQRNLWLRIRREYPEIPIVVAGDLNQTLGGSRRYGSPATRDALVQALSDAELMCQTSGDEPTGQLRRIHLVDHICATNHLNAGGNYNLWGPKTADGLSMSDHAGIAIEFTRPDRLIADRATTAAGK